MTKRSLAFVTAMVAAAIGLAAFRFYSTTHVIPDFNCHGRVYVHDDVFSGQCLRSSAFDVFFTLKKNGEGYALVSGTSLCAGEKAVVLKNDVVHYTYTKDGSFYTLHFKKRDSMIGRFAREFRENYLRIKITPVNNGNYIISTPVETMMMCTRKE